MSPEEVSENSPSMTFDGHISEYTTFVDSFPGMTLVLKCSHVHKFKHGYHEYHVQGYRSRSQEIGY